MRQNAATQRMERETDGMRHKGARGGSAGLGLLMVVVMRYNPRTPSTRHFHFWRGEGPEVGSAQALKGLEQHL